MEGVQQLKINLSYLEENDKLYRNDLLYIFNDINDSFLENTKEKIYRVKIRPPKNVFNGKKLVFTGKMGIKRSEIIILASKYGATTCNVVSKYTDILVVGIRAGSKLYKAKKLGIKILLEDEFWNIIDQGINIII